MILADYPEIRVTLARPMYQATGRITDSRRGGTWDAPAPVFVIVWTVPLPPGSTLSWVRRVALN